MVKYKNGFNRGRGNLNWKDIGLGKNKGFTEEIILLGFLTSLIKIL